MSERQFDRRTPVIAIDFDGVLCTDEAPEIGKPNLDVIQEARTLREKGACLVLWTCRTGKDLEAAVEACRSWGLEFDAINANPQFRIDLYGGDPRKIGADEYWDDHAVCISAGKNGDRESQRFQGIATNCTPIAQPYRDYEGGEIPPIQKDFARWVNHKAVFNTCSWGEYVKRG